MLERSTSTSVRPAAVAGMFYPGEADKLRLTITELLGPSAHEMPSAPKAVIVPHAGYIYSGEIAASGYRRLNRDADQVRRIILMGPTHRVFVRGLAVPS